jgi:hypothetical protein
MVGVVRGRGRIRRTRVLPLSAIGPVSALRDFPSNNPPAVQREQPAEIAKPVSALALHAAFTAMPYTDENDGQTALCYRSYFPAPQADLY